MNKINEVDQEKVGSDYVILILAAGSSSRMGRSKQLLKVDGTTLLAKTVQTALNANLSETVVVLGANEIQHRKEIDGLPVKIISNDNWAKGMGTSIKLGVSFIVDHFQSDGVIILVCDQPHLTTDHILDLIEAHVSTKKPIIASTYANSTGVPALFEKKILSELQELEDSQGAKKVISKEANRVAHVFFPHGEIDLDTMEDYDSFIQ